MIAHGRSYEHGFMKKRNGHKLCAKSRAESSFDHQVSICFSCTISEFQNPDHSQRISHGRSYERDFTKKCNGHKLCAKSRVESTFDRFFMHHLRISKY
ncbi:hypothetical protein BHE74_00055728 [Ensete ventricosum]|nr:hypothetical protein BHE74_00055728 [Ensete ventricosum]